MKFRTEIEPLQGEIKLTIDKPLTFVGSCFADNMASRFRKCLWDARNPLGVLFNPMSIATLLELILLNDNAEEIFGESIFEAGKVKHSWLLDSSFSGTEESLREQFRKILLEFPRRLKQGGTLFVTFGTAYCYYLCEKPDFVVANCHKQPAAMFERRSVSAEEICNIWSPLLRELKSRFPGLNVIFTVSPVRHLRDGLHGNRLSKAILLIATDKLCAAHDFCSYFPAYEILNDDLRDYRFYATDLVHPDEMAVEYILEKFLECYVTTGELAVLKEGEKIGLRLRHRPLIADSPEAKKFAAQTAKLYEEFAGRHPTILPKEYQD